MGESIFEAIAREVKEETGLVAVADSWRILDVGQNEKRNTIVVFVLVGVEGGDVAPEVQELGDLRFYSIAEIRDLMDTGKMRKSVEPIVHMFLEGRI